jgi:hypothetical protein
MNTLKSSTVFVGLLALNLFASLFVAQVQAEPNEALGRLFSKPNERNNLDFLRQNQKLKIINTPTEPQQGETVETTQAELPAPITLQGYVKRNDGTKSTLWINNQAVQEGGTIDNVQIGRLNQRSNATPDALNLKIPANGKHIRLKAGQVYEPDTNQIKELKTVEKEKRLNLEETGEIGDADGD